MKNTITCILCLAVVLLLSCTEHAEQEVTQSTSATPSHEITKVVGVARIEPEDGLLYIYSATSGKIEAIHIAENEVVKRGSVLVSMERSADLAQLNQEQAKISIQRSAIQVAEANARMILSDLKKAREDSMLNEKLFASQAITEQALSDSRLKTTRLQLEYKKQLADIDQARKRLPEIQAGVQYRHAMLTEKEIHAAYNGKVLRWDIHRGDYITAGQKLGQFAPEGSLIAVTEVDELFAGRMKPHLKAEIVSQASNEKIGEGEVYFVSGFLKKKSMFADESTVEDRRVKEVKIRLNANGNLVINNRVDCIIYLSE